MKKILFSLFLGLLGLLLASCASSPVQAPPPAQVNLDHTIADLARVVESPATTVRGFGIVAGLFGTGSAECPPQLRQELEKYIWQQFPKAGTLSPREFINSLDTAVVEIIGVIPPMATAGQPFDVVIRPLSSTQTTSLDGGQLYTTDLKEISHLTQFNQYAKTIAQAQGPIYTGHSADPNATPWYVLGGGYPLDNVTVSLLLNQPDFMAAGVLRNRINERFGAKVANAASAGEIQLFIPDKYRDDKVRFLAMIRQLYLAEQPALKQQHIDVLIAQLQTDPNKFVPEVALEALGKASIDKLVNLVKSDDNAVRFHAARCLSNIGDPRVIPVLREFVFDPQSPYRTEALRTLGRNAPLGDAEPVFLKAMEQEDMELRLAAYEAALAAQSSIINRTLIVAGNFFVDKVLCNGPKAVYAFRKDRPGIVIFGSPIRCSDSIFLQSDNGEVTLNARPGDKHISVSRKHPNRPRVFGPIASGFELTQLIHALGESPEPKQGTATLPGLALSYSQIIEILEKMCKNNVINAHYAQGSVTTAGEILKKL